MPVGKTMEDAPSVSIMSCHRLDRGARALRDKLTELRRSLQRGVPPELQAAHRPAYAAMLDDLRSLQASLQLVAEGFPVTGSMDAQNQRFAATITMILDDAAMLAGILQRLGADSDAVAPRG